MDFLTFRERMYPMGCFNINQVLLWEKDFDRNNLEESVLCLSGI